MDYNLQKNQNCYTEKKDKQVVKLMRIENIESIEEQ